MREGKKENNNAFFFPRLAIKSQRIYGNRSRHTQRPVPSAAGQPRLQPAPRRAPPGGGEGKGKGKGSEWKGKGKGRGRGRRAPAAAAGPRRRSALPRPAGGARLPRSSAPAPGGAPRAPGAPRGLGGPRHPAAPRCSQGSRTAAAGGSPRCPGCAAPGPLAPVMPLASLPAIAPASSPRTLIHSATGVREARCSASSHPLLNALFSLSSFQFHTAWVLLRALAGLPRSSLRSLLCRRVQTSGMSTARSGRGARRTAASPSSSLLLCSTYVTLRFFFSCFAFTR